MPQYNMAKLAQGFWRRHQKTAGATETLINFGQKLAPYQQQLGLASLLGTAASSGAYGYGQTGTPLGAALGAVGGVGGGHIGGHLGSALANRLGFDYTKDVKHVLPHVLMNVAGDIGGTMAGAQLSRLAKPKPFFTPGRRNAALLAALAGTGALGYALSKTSSARRAKQAASLRPKTASDAAHGAASLAALVPFGSSLVGYLRGNAVGRPEAGVVRGILGSSVGHALGRLASGVPAAILTGDPVITSTVGAIGSMGGRVLGHHLATKGLVEEARRRRLTRAALAGVAGAGALGYALRNRDED